MNLGFLGIRDLLLLLRYENHAKIVSQDVLTQELRTLQKQELESDLVVNKYEVSRTSNEETQERIDELEARIETLDQDLNSLLAQLRVITGPALPAGVVLSTVVPQGEDFTILGTAGSHAETLQYVVILRESGLFEDARVQSVEGRGGADPNFGGTVSFQVRVFHLLAVEPEEEESTIG